MKPKLEMKLGAEPKKVAILIALLAVAGYFFYQNVWNTGGDEPAAAPARPASAQPVAAQPPTQATTAASRVAPAPPKQAGPAGARGPREFRPSLKPRSDSERAGMQAADPTLRIDRLQRLAAVKVDRADRNLFEFGMSAPVVQAAKPKLPEPKIVVKKRMIGPEPPPPPPPPPPPAVKTPPPPIPLKFYGNLLPKKDGLKRVFCVQGEDILTPTEGELIQKRYRIVRINATSVVVEDVNFKHQQTIPIEEPVQGG